MNIKVLLAVVSMFVSLCGAARAAVLSPDPTGLWYDPNESGWGLSLDQQGDTVFALLFVYADSLPQWYVASSVQYSSDMMGVPGGPSISGTLYRTTGPWFGVPFDPRAVTASSVGSIQMYYDGATGDSMWLTYTIGGTTVQKQVQRQSWRDARAELAGHYQGSMVVDGSNTGGNPAPGASCASLPVAPAPNAMPAFNVTTGAAAGDIHIVWGTGIDTVCSIDGTYSQSGQLGSISGTLKCGPVGSGVPVGSVRVYGIKHDYCGMTGGIFVAGSPCFYTAHLGGVRVP